MCLGLVIVGPLLALLVGMVLRVWGAGRVDSTWPWVAKARQGQDARWSSALPGAQGTPLAAFSPEHHKDSAVFPQL